jgi:hypothetical protein
MGDELLTKVLGQQASSQSRPRPVPWQLLFIATDIEGVARQYA